MIPAGQEMTVKDAVEHLRIRAALRCDTKGNLCWSLMDVTAVWAVAKALQAAYPKADS